MYGARTIGTRTYGDGGIIKQTVSETGPVIASESLVRVISTASPTPIAPDNAKGVLVLEPYNHIEVL